MHLNGNIQMEIVFKLLSSCSAADKWTAVVRVRIRVSERMCESEYKNLRLRKE